MNCLPTRAQLDTLAALADRLGVEVEEPASSALAVLVIDDLRDLERQRQGGRTRFTGPVPSSPMPYRWG